MRVLAVTGSSGGHIFPALSFLDTLKDRHKGIDALLVMPRSAARFHVLAGKCRVEYISISPLGSGFNFKNLNAVLNLLKGSLESLFIMFEFRPDVVVGFGTIDCVPLLLLAWIFRVKTLIHEQNVSFGRANKLLAHFADKTAISFEETRQYLKCRKKNIVLTGNPIRKELKVMDKREALSFFGLKESRLTVLVMGGSQASHRINQGFLEAVSALPDISKLQIIHICGIKDYKFVRDKYRALDADSRVFDFLDAMQYAYNACDLIVSRAGATSITEMMYFGLPAILIPYPYAYEHQLNNARVLESKGRAFIIKDEDLDKGALTQRMGAFINNPGELKGMRSNYAPLPENSAGDLLVKEVMSLSEA
ncbi:MAG: UDP-N-acetylglucosamine--N-acetylmuramyl-(pentapeptide) pyrophosphoryl-undecaprenol N-acetylglucosamine transferase [Candidatus Omnitrophota bacterium]